MKKTNRPARRGFTLVALALAALGVATAGSAAAKKEPAVEKPVPPAKVDRDKDKLFDDLEQRLEKLGPGEDVDVIVRLTAPRRRRVSTSPRSGSAECVSCAGSRSSMRSQRP